ERAHRIFGARIYVDIAVVMRCLEWHSQHLERTVDGGCTQPFGFQRVPPRANVGGRNLSKESLSLHSGMFEKFVDDLVVMKIRSNLDITLRAFQPFEQISLRGAKMQRLANSSLVQVRNDLATVAFSQASLACQFCGCLPFIGQSLCQLPVGGFGGAFEPLNLSVAANAVVTGDPVRTFRRVMCVLGDRTHSWSEL